MILYLFTFLFGLIIGSFLNCLIWRLHTGESMWNRSHCPKCKKLIGWYDNIPIVSFLFLGGKCRHCKKAISWQYPVVELIVGILFTMAFYHNIYSISNIQINPNLQSSIFDLILNFQFLIFTLRDWFIISVMVIIFIYDLRWYLILDEVSLTACVIMFIVNLLLGFSWMSLMISGAIGAGFFLTQFLISKGKWIGGGDIRLGLLMGISLGKFDKLLLALFLAYLLGSAVGLVLIATGKKKWGSKVPLGIFLSTSTVCVLFFGERILKWYWGGM